MTKAQRGRRRACMVATVSCSLPSLFHALEGAQDGLASFLALELGGAFVAGLATANLELVAFQLIDAQPLLAADRALDGLGLLLLVDLVGSFELIAAEAKLHVVAG